MPVSAAGHVTSGSPVRTDDDGGHSTLQRDGGGLQCQSIVPLARTRRLEELDQIAHPVVTVPRMAKREFVMHFVKVPAPVSALGQVTGSLEVIDDLRSRALGDSNRFGDVSEAGGRVSGNGFEHMRVIGD